MLDAAIETMVPLLAGWLDDLNSGDASRSDRAEELRLVRQFAVGLKGERGGPNEPWLFVVTDLIRCRPARWLA
jgi:hypothetical protein